MKPFIFSADSPIREPNTLFVEGLPSSMRGAAIFARRTDDFIQTRTEERVIHRLWTRGNDAARQIGRRGAHDLNLCLEDMILDGVDAEIITGQTLNADCGFVLRN